MIAIAVSSAMLLRASRTRAPRDWAIYAVALLVGLYDYTLFAGVAAGHALWMLLDRRARPVERSYLLAAFLPFALWSPWLLVTLAHPGGIGARLPTTPAYVFTTFVLPNGAFNLPLPFFPALFWEGRPGCPPPPTPAAPPPPAAVLL